MYMRAVQLLRSPRSVSAVVAIWVFALGGLCAQDGPSHGGRPEGDTAIPTALADEPFGLTEAQQAEMLCRAAGLGKLEVLKFLLDAGFEAGAKLPDGSTALHAAAAQGHALVVRELLARGAPVNAPDDFGVTPLHLACAGARLSVVRLLLQSGADAGLRAFNGTTALHQAAGRGARQVCELLVESGADVNVRDDNNRTPLHLAARSHHDEVAEFLVAAGADVDVYAAACLGDLPRVTALLEAEPELATVALRTGDTPLHWAAIGGHRDVVAFILEEGADVNSMDGDISPLWLAVSEGHKEVVDLLLEEGANPDLGFEMVPPLAVACKRRDWDVARALVQAGADVNIREPVFGWTPLHFAVLSSQKDLVILLLEEGADPNVKDSEDLTPAELAEDLGRYDLAELVRRQSERE